MKVALLGHTGFLGRNIEEQFRIAGIECMGASKNNGIDLREPDQVADFLNQAKPDVIFHCAAHVGSFHYVTENASAVMLDNSRLVLSVYEAMARVSSRAVIVHPLANCVFPATAELLKEDEWQSGPVHQSVLPFASSRRLAWAVGESFSIKHGIRSRYLLVPNMYGPYDSVDPNQTAALDALISRFLTAKRIGQSKVTVWGTGSAVREWIFAPDLSRIFLDLALNPDLIGLQKPLNVAQGCGLSIRELVEIIKLAVGFEGEVHYDATKPDGVLKKVMDDTRFRQIFPKFKFTDFHVGITKTIKYYESVII